MRSVALHSRVASAHPLLEMATHPWSSAALLCDSPNARVIVDGGSTAISRRAILHALPRPINILQAKCCGRKQRKPCVVAIVSTRQDR